MQKVSAVNSIEKNMFSDVIHLYGKIPMVGN